jgi:DNA-binding LacI/PurR family transcriptional regulator
MAKPPRASRVTLNDVAALAGVGRTTVSDILNRGGQGRYADETCQKVLDAVGTLGYAPSRAAQQLAHGRSGTVGLMLTRDFSNPYWARLADAVEKALRGQGRRMQLAITQNDPEIEMQHMRQLRADGVEGVVIGPVYEPADLQQHRGYFQDTLPTVIFGASLSGYDAVCDAHRAEGELAVDHLLEHGHRRIGYLCVPDADIEADRESRFAALRERLRPQGLLQTEWIMREPDTGDYRQFRVVATAFARRWLDADPKHRPTAAICHNDQVALATIAAFNELGLRVPEDVSLIGFDNLPECEAVHPTLTSIDGRVNQQMQQAISLLMERIDQPNRASRVYSPQPKLHQRRSVRDLQSPCSTL